MKKILSIFLGTALIISTFSGILTAQAETTTYAVGDRPYATANSKTDVIIKSGDDIVFYDDYIMKDNIESYADTAAIFSSTSWKLGSKFEATATYNSAELNTDENYSYSGNSFKFNYMYAAPDKIVAQGDTQAQYYHKFSSIKEITVNSEFWSTVAIGFWLKTEHEIDFTFRVLDNSYGSAQSLVSKRIRFAAGEYFVQVPLSALAVLNENYVKGNGTATTSTKLIYPEFFVRATAKYNEGETERSIYLDNIGYYNICPNADTAVHNKKAMTKDGVKDYIQNSTDATRVEHTVTGEGTYFWTHADAANSTTKAVISPCDESDGVNENAYKGIGQSIKYDAAKIYNYTQEYYNGIRTNSIIQNSDSYTNRWGREATLAIWVKTSRAITVYASAGDSVQTGNNVYKTDKTYTLPAGESILRIPLEDFNVPNTSGSYTCDNAFTWKSLTFLKIYFKCASPRENNMSDGITVYFDEFAIESPIIGDVNDDMKTNIADLVGLKNYVSATEAEGNVGIYDVGSDAVDDKGYSVSDGVANSTDLTVMIKYLLGTTKLSRKLYIPTDTTEQTLVVSTLADWGTDTE